MDEELVQELKKCLDKFWRTMALPRIERAPFAAGIAKLETRIEQLRAATGMDTDQLVSRVREILRMAYCGIVPMDALDNAEFSSLAECLDRAGACFRVGDQPGAVAALSEMESCAKRITQMVKQKEFAL